MVHSTTSSHYSVFSQRIPDHDLRYVRNYIQFKTRLEGMEVFLENLQRDVWRKEVQVSEAFSNCTVLLWRLFKEFSSNKELMKLVMEYYDLMAEWDFIWTKLYRLRGIRDEKLALMDGLTEDYNAIPNSELDRKLELGQKIKSIKLEINKGIDCQIGKLEQRIRDITSRVDGINGEIDEIQYGREQQESYTQTEDFDSIIAQFSSGIQDIRESLGFGQGDSPIELDNAKIGELEHNVDERVDDSEQ